MIAVKFFKLNGDIMAVECSGHAGYAEEGSDIICAAVSTVVQTAVLGLISVAGLNIGYKVIETKGYLKATLPSKMSEKERHDADIILKTLYLGLSDLYEGYSDFINLEEDIYVY